MHPLLLTFTPNMEYNNAQLRFDGSRWRVHEMAEQEHLDVIKQGAKIWNKWRHQFILKIVDLSDADLSGIDLSGADHTLTGRFEVEPDPTGANYRKSSIKWNADNGDWIETYVVGAWLNR